MPSPRCCGASAAARLGADAEEALAWMVTEGILTRVTALATRRADGRGIELEIATTPPRGNDAAVRFAYLTGS